MADIEDLFAAGPPRRPVAVLFCGDAAYTPLIAVAAYTLRYHNPELPADLYIASEDAGLAAQLANVPAGRGGIYRLTGIADAIGDLNAPRRNVRAAYLPLAAVSALPAGVDRVVYLDGDTVTLGSLAPLAELGLGEAPLAAVADRLQAGAVQTHMAELGEAPRAAMFNTGVLVVDRRRWEAQGIGAAALDWLRRQPSPQYGDQDALNVVVGTDWQRLDRRYNYQCPLLLGKTLRARDDDPDTQPVVYHYTCPVKPWHPWAPAAYRATFQAYAEAALGAPYENDRLRPGDDPAGYMAFMTVEAPSERDRHKRLLATLQERCPRSPAVWNYAFTLARQDGRTADAFQAAETAMALGDPPALQSRLNMMKAYMFYGRYGDAKATGEAALAQHGGHGWLHYYLAVALANLGALGEAAAQAEAAVAAAPETQAFRSLQARIGELRGQGAPDG